MKVHELIKQLAGLNPHDKVAIEIWDRSCDFWGDEFIVRDSGFGYVTLLYVDQEKILGDG
jgi:hypothetical protein